MAQTLKFGNGTWATKKGSTLAYNDEGGNFKPLPFTYTGAGKGTRVNKEGLIEVVENDRPRIDYTDSEDGVFLLEKAATNLFPYSQYYGSGGLVVYAIGTQTHTITNNYSISPDGTLNAIRFQATVGVSSSDRVVLRDTLTTTAVDSTVSVYAKSNTTSNYTLVFHYEGGTRDTFVVTPEWQRFTYSELSNTINNVGVELKGDVTSLEADVSLYGFQFENNSHASSYIPTQGTIQTRVQETASGSGNSEVFNSEQGVLFADISALEDSTNQRWISVGSGGNANRVSILFNATSRIDCSVRGSSATIYDAFANIGSQTRVSKAAVKYKNSDFAFFVNGFKVDSQQSGSVSFNAPLSELAFDSADGNSDFYGKTKEIAYYDEVLTDLELETLTSYRTWEEMVNELNLNIIHNE